jgi:hypothetical protein
MMKNGREREKVGLEKAERAEVGVTLIKKERKEK